MKQRSSSIPIPGRHYLVGGAVRDHLLQYPSHEKDYVVVGATEEAMLAAGFRRVGKDFPVFLHPETHDEYALARTERKTGKGYHAFECDTDPHVTLEEDLLRRDLTINAMAMDEDGQIIDPYHGEADIHHKLLRHVSPAFVEDPVRILRIARFAARFHHLGFTVAPDTLALMQTMVNNGEVNALVAERVWKETERAFEERNPEIYIQVLQQCGALAILMPELNDILKNESDIRFAALQRIARTDLPWDKTIQAALRFAVLAHGLRIRSNTIPPSWFVYLEMYQIQRDALEQWNTLSSTALLALLNTLDAFRRDARFNGFLDMIAALQGQEAKQHLLKTYRIAAAVPLQPIIDAHKGPAIKDAIDVARAQAIDEWLNSR